MSGGEIGHSETLVSLLLHPLSTPLRAVTCIPLMSAPNIYNYLF